MLRGEVAPTGIDPVTFRFSVTLGLKSHSIYGVGSLLTRHFPGWSQLLAVGSAGGNGPNMAQVCREAAAGVT